MSGIHEQSCHCSACLLMRARAKRNAARAEGSTKLEDSEKFTQGVVALGFSPEEDISLERGWQIFEEQYFGHLVQIVNEGLPPSPKPIEKMLYFSIQHLTYKMATKNKASQVYEALAKTIRAYLENILSSVLSEKSGKSLLQELRQRWWNHIYMSHWLNAANTHLNDNLNAICDHPKVMSLLLKPFYEIIWLNVREAVLGALIDEIEQSRDSNGACCDRELIKDTVKMITHMGACKGQSNILDVRPKFGLKKNTWKDAPLLLEHKDLSVYLSDFQAGFIKSSREYYEAKALRWKSEESVGTYLDKARAAIEHERTLVSECLDAQTCAPLIIECEDTILRGPGGANLKYLVESATGVPYMLKNNMLSKLQMMHIFLQNIQEQQRMADTVQKHICLLGKQVVRERIADVVRVQSSERKARDEAQAHAQKRNKAAKIKTIKEVGIKESPHFVKKLLAIYTAHDAIREKCFAEDPLFEKAMAKAFDEIMSFEPEHSQIDLNLVRVQRNAEMLAAHMHKFLFRKADNFEDGQLEARICECAYLFRFVVDKDLFLVIHKKLLAQRLLRRNSLSNISIEKTFIRELKKDQDKAYTAPLETMLLDIEKCYQINDEDRDCYNSRDWDQKWGQYLQSAATARRGELGTIGKSEEYKANEPKTEEQRSVALHPWGESAEFNVRVLTMRCWPAAPSPPYLIIPHCLTEAFNLYNKFFKSFDKHSERHLAWAHTLGNVELKIKAKKGTRILSMTPLQAYVCLCFKSFSHTMTGEELHKILSLEDRTDCLLKKAERLKRVLFMLTTKKARVLTMTDEAGKKLTKMDIKIARFRPNYGFTSDKRKVSVPFPEFPNTKQVARVMEERGGAIDATIVRIMKAAGRKEYKDLVSDVMGCITMFETDARSIKKRISKLMDEEYIRRDPDNPSVFEYLA